MYEVITRSFNGTRRRYLVDATTEDAAEATEEAADDAAAATDDATDGADTTEDAATATEEAAETIDGVKVPDVLTVDGFDYDSAVQMVDDSNLNAGIKLATKSALEKARDDPEVLEQVLTQLRNRLGMSE